MRNAVHGFAHGHGAAAAKPRRARCRIEARDAGGRAPGERGALDDHSRQAIAAAALLADAQTESLLAFGELKDDVAELGVDKLLELAGFDRRTFDESGYKRCRPAWRSRRGTCSCPTTRRATAISAGATRRPPARSVATHVVEIDAKHVGAYAQAGRAFATRALPDVILLAQNAVDAKLPFVGAGERLAADFIRPAHDAAQPYRDLGLDEIDAASGRAREARFHRIGRQRRVRHQRVRAAGRCVRRGDRRKPRRDRQRPLHARQAGRCDRQDGRGERLSRSASRARCSTWGFAAT